MNTDNSVAAPTAKKNNTPASMSIGAMFLPYGKTAYARNTGTINATGARKWITLSAAR